MKKFLVALSALFVIAAYSGTATTPGQKSKEKILKVISYNIRNGEAKDGENSWVYRRPATIAMLEAEDPAIFGVQEAYDYQVEYISKWAPKYKNLGVGRDDGVRKGEHMSVFYDTTRVQILDGGTYWLSETPDVPSKGWGANHYRTATWTKLRHLPTGKEFFYVNTHLDHRSAPAQKNGLALIVNRIAQMNPEHLPMILTGDFNIRPDSENLVELDKMMHSARVFAESTTTEGSFNGWGEYGASSGAPIWQGEVPVKAAPIIDYIYYSGFSKCLTFRVLNQPYVGVPYISDHYPIAATLKF